MATLVLNSVGTALGGPVGSAIGALIGQSIDQQLLAPPRRGPRVGDMTVQTSSYGTQIPRIHGTMRVAGSVVWATDLVERELTGGAKGQPDVSYSYTVSMAVALSSRRASSIKRIWADGKLLRGAAGDLKVGGTLRLCDGSEDQAVDPLIASLEGIGSTPAYRGLALAVFEDLELAEFGNRIPFLTFEIQADDVAPSVGAILSDTSGGFIDSDAATAVTGFAAYGSSVRSAIQPLVDAFGIELFDDGRSLRGTSSPEPLTISETEFGYSRDSDRAPRFQREQMPARSLPVALRLSYYEPDRDYQAGEARATAGEEFGSEAKSELAAVLNAADAKSLAQRMLTRAWVKRDTVTLRLPPSRLPLEPGSMIELPFTPSRWTVEKTTIDGFVVVAEMKPFHAGTIALAADGGRIAPNSDAIAGPVSLALLDIPALSPNSPTLFLAASSPTPGWRRAHVDLTFVGQNIAVWTAARKSVLGSTATILPPADPASIDTASSVEVQLIDADQWLTSCDDNALAAGANVALIGGEVVQFGDVTPLGNGRFRLDRFLRGRGDTEPAIASHAVGEVFCLIEAGSLQSIGLPVTSIGKLVTAEIPGGASVSVTVRSRADGIASPSGGTTIDQEGRASIDQILATLRLHGLIAT